MLGYLRGGGGAGGSEGRKEREGEEEEGMDTTLNQFEIGEWYLLINHNKIPNFLMKQLVWPESPLYGKVMGGLSPLIFILRGSFKMILKSIMKSGV